jgi:UDP-glucuronate decarboxylase
MKGGIIYLISGATGWLGRATINHLLKNEAVTSEDIIALGSRERIEKFGTHYIRIHSNETLPKGLNVNLYFDFAFVTREFEHHMGEKAYIKANKNLISSSEKLLTLTKPKYVFLASSGAVYDSLAVNKHSTVYGDLKLEQEERVRKYCENQNSQISVCRIFNISGEFMGKSETFALSNFLKTAHYEKQITLESRNKVLRRYCSDIELIALVLAMQRDNFATDFDSGGHEIELHRLARIVKDVVGGDIKLNNLTIDNKLAVNSYLSKSQKYEELVKRYLNKTPMSLVQQIELAYHGIKPKG